MDFPTIECKALKPRYYKSDAVRELEQLANNEARRLHPDCPTLAKRAFRDNTANGLTKCITAFIRLKGYQAERISCMGRYVDNSRVVTDILGDMKRIGSGKWLPTSGQRGTSDISAVIHGRAIKIEVKMKDSQSPAQKEYQLQVERAGGLYWLVRSFEEFLEYYNTMV